MRLTGTYKYTRIKNRKNILQTYGLKSDTWDRISDQPHVSVCNTERWRNPSFRLYILKHDTYLKTDATVSYLRSVSQLEQCFKPSPNQSSVHVKDFSHIYKDIRAFACGFWRNKAENYLFCPVEDIWSIQPAYSTCWCAVIEVNLC